MSDEIFDEIGRFDGDYAPKMGQLPGLDKMPDGTYELEIVFSELGRTQKTNQAILKTALRIASGGCFEWVHFFDTQDKVDRCGADLAALGFAEFTGKGGFSVALKKALPRMKGVRFRATKTTDTGKDGKKYHNLFVAGPVAAGTRSAPPAARPLPGQSPAQPAAQPPAQGGETGGSSEGEIIPF